jgi:hypothetical protein
MRNITIHTALSSLRPKAKWTAYGTEYENVQWQDEVQSMPTKEEVLAEVARLEPEQQNTEYQRLRAAEYPDFRDYLDAVVKGDTAQMEAYVAECLAVKAKYPKPE